MNTALKADFVSVEDYLRGEEVGDVRHEYVAGNIFAMAGGSGAHSLICCNIIAALHAQLRGPCRVFDANMKVRVAIAENEFFYYPDVTVSCHPFDPALNYNEHASVIVEVLSPSTERVDRIEKFDHYKEIDSLHHYVLVAQDRMEVLVFSRASGWKAEILTNFEDHLRLASIAASMTLRQIYHGVPFTQR